MIEEQIQNLPPSPGVYLMKDHAGNVLYVGKAKNLRQRVKTYFSSSADARYSLRFLLPKIQQLETIITDTEKEALLLENNLIKKYRPRYNIIFKDDKTYFSLKFNLQEDFPRLTLVRKIKQDGARYFGPFASSAAVKETIRLMHQLFPLRSCRETEFRHRSRPCLNFQIKKCLGPCCGLISKEKYRELAEEALLFLEGKNDQLIKILRQKMSQAAEELRFEEAARLRDQIQAVEKTLEKQKTSFTVPTDQDVFAFYRQGNLWEFQILFFRRGLLIGHKSFSFSQLNLPEEEALSAFIQQYYASATSLPQEVLLPSPIENEQLLTEWLSEKKGKPVKIIVPRKGPKKELVKLALKNAQNNFQKRVGEKANLELILQELQEKLRLPKLPRRIECFDISNLLGTLAVGSMVTFCDGQPDHARYRHFKVHAPALPDDYAMMYEILQRRYSKISGPEDKPDLLIIDGGKGHLNVALAVLQELHLSDISAIALAKDKDADSRQRKEKRTDKIYLPNVKDPLLLPAHSAVLHYLQKIRDEAHRFAINYHQKLRGKKGLETILDEIPGIGEIKKKVLLRAFGSLPKIREATIESLTKIKPLTLADAQRIFAFFHPALNERSPLPCLSSLNSSKPQLNP
jgi:excinuclease ABC subunit C